MGRPRQFKAADIQKIVPVNRASSGEGSGAKLYYDIDVVCTGGKRVTVGKRVREKHLAEAVIRQIEKALGR
jgi:hypothetical protein